MDGKVAKYGFYTPRFVEAIDEVLAEATALENFRDEAKMQDLSRALLNGTDDPPRFEVEETAEIDSFDGIDNLTPGLGFYPEDEKNS